MSRCINTYTCQYIYIYTPKPVYIYIYTFIIIYFKSAWYIDIFSFASFGLMSDCLVLRVGNLMFAFYISISIFTYIFRKFMCI